MKLPHPLIAWTGTLTLVGMLGTGCGPNCQSTCNRIYQSPCNVERPGRTAAQLVDDCRDTCEEALTTPGELGDYNPLQDRGSASDYPLENDRQAAAWMDCVEVTSCELFTEGYCPPIW